MTVSSDDMAFVWVGLGVVAIALYNLIRYTRTTWVKWDKANKTINALTELDPTLIEIFPAREGWWHDDEFVLNRRKIRELAEIKRNRNKRVADTTELDEALGKLKRRKKHSGSTTTK